MPPREAKVMTISGRARWYILSQNRSHLDQVMEPAVCMPETGNQPSTMAKIMQAMENTHTHRKFALM